MEIKLLLKLLVEREGGAICSIQGEIDTWPAKISQMRGHKTLASHNDKAEYRGLCAKHIEIRSARYTLPSEFDRKAKFSWICTLPQN